jgi:hypothetical protein
MKFIISLFILVTVLFSLLILWAIYDAQFSPRAIEGKRNEILVTRLKLEQPSDSVIAIMGEPKRVHYYGSSPKGSVYCYESTNGDFLDMEIELDSQRKIYRIFNPGKCK